MDGCGYCYISSSRSRGIRIGVEGESESWLIEFWGMMMTSCRNLTNTLLRLSDLHYKLWAKEFIKATCFFKHQILLQWSLDWLWHSFKVLALSKCEIHSIALLSHFDKVLALSKITLLKCKIEVNPIAWIPRAFSTAQFQFAQYWWPRESMLLGSFHANFESANTLSKCESTATQ